MFRRFFAPPLLRVSAFLVVFGTIAGTVQSLQAGAVGGPQHGNCQGYGGRFPRVQFRAGEPAAVTVVGEGGRVQILDEAGNIVAEDSPLIVGGLSRAQAVAIVVWKPATTQTYTIKVGDGDNGSVAAGYKTN